LITIRTTRRSGDGNVFIHAPHGADQGWGRGYIKKETGRKMIMI
jgi:hypothetical protein